MNSSIRKLTEAAILTSVFIVITLFALSTGIGYGIYLDFGVPIVFALIYFRCDFKYTLLSGISSIAIIMLVLGNFITAILISQSFLLGIICGYLLSLNSGIFDDLFWGSIGGVIFMVLIDIYARNLIGYSFMEEFQGYIDFFKNPPTYLLTYLPFIKHINFEILYYSFIAIFPFGMVFSIYFISLMFGKKLRLLKENEKRKYFMMRSIRNLGSFMTMCNKNFYLAIGYILIFNLLGLLNIKLSVVYIKTIGTCIEYLCYYFVIRDCYMTIGNYINIKYKKKYLSIIYMIASLVLLFKMFLITSTVFVITAIIMDKKIQLRLRQNNVVESHTDKLIETYKI
ncbi:MAG: DUF2232 domain-containing protein [Terrisporobacter sp.]